MDVTREWQVTSFPHSPAVTSPGGDALMAAALRRPCGGSALLAGAAVAASGSVFWLVTFGPCRLYCLFCLSLAARLTFQLLRGVARSTSTGGGLWRRVTGGWDVMDPDHESSSESPFTDPWISLKMFLEETSSFKQQNPGKFCLLVCSLCSFLAVLGHYVPGIVISYVLVLAVFLWPLVSPTDLGPWVEPVLQKLDFGVGEFLQRIKENHEKRTLRSQMDRESPEADLSSLFPKLDSDACKELSVSDTEVTWTDNGTFNLSEGHTPQTENSDDLDRPSDQEEVFSAGLPEFPSVENGMGTNGDEDEDLSIGLPTAAATSRSKPKLGRAALAEEAPPTAALELVQRMAEDAIASAVTAAVQGTLPSPPPSSSSSSSTSSTPTSADALARALAEDSDSEAEDFELLDQSELEQLEGELGLNRAGQVAPAPSSTPPTGFISKLLGRR